MAATNTTRVRGAGTLTGSDIALAAIIGGVGFAALGTWLSGQVAGLLFRQHWPRTPIDQALTITIALPRHWSDPRQAWPATAHEQIPGPAGFYTAALLVFAAMTALTLIAWRWLRTDRDRKGMATLAQLDRKLSARSALKQTNRLRPNLTQKATAADVALPLGEADGRTLHASLESSVLLVAPPRIGKTSRVIIPWVRHFPGAAVVTSVRADVLRATATLRKGTSWLLTLEPSFRWPHEVQWTPLAGCDDFDIARQRADVMIRVGKDERADSSNAGFFGMTATNLMAAWLHTANLSGKTMRDVRDWASNPYDDTPVTLLRQATGAQDGMTQLLASIYQQPEATRANLWATAQTATSALFGHAAEKVFCGDTANSFDIEAFLRSGTDTLYVIIDEKKTDALAPLVTAFIDEITTIARRLALETKTGRLDPPLGLILDELTNAVPLPDAPQAMSYLAGFGVCFVGVLQNLAAAERRWHTAGRDEMWGNATLKIALGGLGGTDLETFSNDAGTYRETLLVPQRNKDGIHVQASVVDRRTITAHRVRTLDEQRGEALILHKTTAPVITRMARYDHGPDAGDYTTAQADADTLMNAARNRPSAPEATP